MKILVSACIIEQNYNLTAENNYNEEAVIWLKDKDVICMPLKCWLVWICHGPVPKL